MWQDLGQDSDFEGYQVRLPITRYPQGSLYYIRRSYIPCFAYTRADRALHFSA